VSRAECEKIEEDLWHWNDIDTSVGREVNSGGRYGGWELHGSLRMLAREIHGGLEAALSDGYYGYDAERGLLTTGPLWK
jgi:hypothetical protein